MLDLSAVISRVNDSGDGLWDLKSEIKEIEDGFIEVWIIDSNEFVTSDNFMDGWIWRSAIYPIEEAVKEQTGDSDFYLDAYDYAGRFVGSTRAIHK